MRLRSLVTAGAVVGVLLPVQLSGAEAAPLEAAAGPATWVNPISADALKDPFVVASGGTYHLLGSFLPVVGVPSASGAGLVGAAVNIPAYRSTDLATWTFSHDALPLTQVGAWVDVTRPDLIGGPTVVERPANAAAQRWVLYYSARNVTTATSCVGAATAATPAGPFTGQPTPLVCAPGIGNAVTPSVYVPPPPPPASVSPAKVKKKTVLPPPPPPDPCCDLLWVDDRGTDTDEIAAQALTDDGLSLRPGAVRRTLLTAQANPSAWEKGRFDNPAFLPSPAGPVLTYSANDPTAYTYGINWAACTAVGGLVGSCGRGQEGPWVWFQGRVDVSAPGAADFFTDAGGGAWMVYRGMSSTCAPDCGTRATPRIDKVCVDTSNGIQPRTTAPSLGGTLGRLPADCAADVQTVAENWLAADAMFHKDPQWRGGDGAQSVPLGNGTVMWTFGDSFVDAVPYAPRADVQWERGGSSFVRNSIGLQTGTDPSAPATTFKGYWGGTGGTPGDFFPAPEPGHWLWGNGGSMVGTRLVLFFGDRSGGGLGTYNGEHIVYVDNPTATTPDQWVKQSAFPRSTTTDFGFVVEQSAALLDGAYLLVYYQGGGGTGCAAAVGTRLARFAVADIAAGDFSKREWWDGTAFLAQSSFGGCDAAPPVVANLGMANGGGGGAVLKDAAGRYVEFAGGAFFGGGFTQAAASPAGPWPGGVNRMVAPENTRENVTTYIWNPHAGLTGAGAGRTWVTWCSNGSTVFSDESVYYPRFAKLADPA